MSAAEIPLSIVTEDIERQIERAEKNGDARLLGVAFLRRFVKNAEAAEGRTNRYYSRLLERLITEAEKGRAT